MPNRRIGLTRTAGYQVGARRSFPVRLEEAWRFLTSAEGVKLWLGHAPRGGLEPGKSFTLRDGARCAVRVFSPNHHLRITWHPPGWARSSTLQVRVIPQARGTTIAFHQEHLPSAQHRADRRRHFGQVLDEIEGRLVR